MARIVAVANQKGGVAKTTTVHALGFALAQLGRRVLLVDLDPQACLTYSVGIDPENLHQSLHDVFVRKMKAADAPVASWPVWTASTSSPPPSTSPGPRFISSRVRGVSTSSPWLSATVADDYDMIIIDCPPSLGVLTINGLTAANEVLIPLQCEALSHRGVGQLLETIDDVRMFANADLEVRGVIATMYDERTRHGKAVLDDVQGPVRPERVGATGAQVDPVRRGTRPGSVHPPTRTDVTGRRGLSRHRSRARRRPASGPLSDPAERRRGTWHGRVPDPLGKRALFWAPAERDEGGPRRAAERDAPGKHALFSAEARAVGDQGAAVSRRDRRRATGHPHRVTCDPAPAGESSAPSPSSARPAAGGRRST